MQIWPHVGVPVDNVQHHQLLNVLLEDAGLTCWVCTPTNATPTIKYAPPICQVYRGKYLLLGECLGLVRSDGTHNDSCILEKLRPLGDSVLCTTPKLRSDLQCSDRLDYGHDLYHAAPEISEYAQRSSGYKAPHVLTIFVNTLLRIDDSSLICIRGFRRRGVAQGLP